MTIYSCTQKSWTVPTIQHFHHVIQTTKCIIYNNFDLIFFRRLCYFTKRRRHKAFTKTGGDRRRLSCCPTGTGQGWENIIKSILSSALQSDYRWVHWWAWHTVHTWWHPGGQWRWATYHCWWAISFPTFLHFAFLFFSIQENKCQFWKHIKLSSSTISCLTLFCLPCNRMCFSSKHPCFPNLWSSWANSPSSYFMMRYFSPCPLYSR